MSLIFLLSDSTLGTVISVTTLSQQIQLYEGSNFSLTVGPAWLDWTEKCANLMFAGPCIIAKTEE